MQGKRKLGQPNNLEDRGTYEFEHEGKKYSLFKREPEGPWYLRVQSAGQRRKKSLDSTNPEVAVERARRIIDGLTADKWRVPAQTELPFAKIDSPLTLADVASLYRSIGGIAPRTIKTNVLCMLKIFERVRGKRLFEDQIFLTDIDRHLVNAFQDETTKAYAAEAEKNDGAQREARDRALRSSRSTICQARSIFTRKGDQDLVERYRERGLVLPACIESFMAAKLRGKLVKPNYFTPPNSVVQSAFILIEDHREDDPDVYRAFWLACGAGLRRKEIARSEWSHVIDRDGNLWISGGRGKDGMRIEVPVQSRAAAALTPFRKSEGWIIEERGDRWAKRLSALMRDWGWQTEKTLHELRAYAGSLLYQKSPLAAMRFLRHKSIAVTEKFYCRYCPTAAPIDVL